MELNLHRDLVSMFPTLQPWMNPILSYALVFIGLTTVIPVVVALFLLLIKSKKSEKVFLIGLASSMGLSILWFLFLFAAATIAGWKNASLIVLTFISMGLLSYAIVIRSSDLCITGKSYIYRTISLVTLLASIFVGAFWIMLKLIEVSP